MEYKREGAVYDSGYPGEGLWRITVPWQVAMDGILRETGKKETGQTELKTWMSENEPRFTEYVFGCLGLFGRPSWEDPRVKYEQVENWREEDDDAE